MASSPAQLSSAAQAVGLKLELAHCCHRELSWECEFERRDHAGYVVEALSAHGYAVNADHGFVVELKHAHGQVVMVVPRTGRVQLRLPYTTPQEQRRDLATRLADHISRALSELLQQVK